MLSHVILTTIVQVAGDLACCVISLICVFSRRCKDKVFFITNSIAFLVLAIGDTYYNYLFRIFHRDIRESVDLVVTLSILIFQLSQTFNWYRLIKQQKTKIVSYDNLAYLLFTVIVVGVLVYYFLTGVSPSFTATWHQSINVALNMVAWFFAIICLARTRSVSITLLTLGCLLIISSALTENRLFMLEMDKVIATHSIHIIWTLGVLTMVVGFCFCLREPEFHFSPPNSIQSTCSSWLSTASLGLFILCFFFFSFFNVTHNLDVSLELWSIPVILVFAMIISVLLGNWFSCLILLPVNDFLKRIEAFNSEKSFKEKALHSTKIYEFKILGDFISDSFQKLSNQLEREVKIAAQVAHDIRSPITGLEVLIKRLPGIEESRQILLRETVNHIKDIINNLEQTTNLDKCGSSTQIVILLDYVLSERRAALSNKSIEINSDFSLESYSLFSEVIPSEMKRVLINVINNACEAMPMVGGIIDVDITREENSVVITIVDNGVGISKGISNLVFERGFTTKNAGSGLGLYHAKEILAKWNGTITLTENSTKGCAVQIKLPTQNPPTWFVSSLSFSKDSVAICVDDSISIWRAWQERFSNIDGNIDLRYCKSKEDLLNEINIRNEKHCTYLVDHEFSGCPYTGLDLVKHILANKKSMDRIFLVTSRSNEKEIQNFCVSENIHMVPKFFALKIPLRIIEGI